MGQFALFEGGNKLRPAMQLSALAIPDFCAILGLGRALFPRPARAETRSMQSRRPLSPTMGGVLFRRLQCFIAALYFIWRQEVA